MYFLESKEQKGADGRDFYTLNIVKISGKD